MGLPAIGIGLGLGGSLLGGIGALGQSQAQAANAEFQAQVARNNQKVAEQNAGLAIQTGEEKATARGLAEAAQLGHVKASQAASGLDINVGSPVDVRAAQAKFGRLDALTEMNNAQLQAYGYRTQATNYLAQSYLDTAEAKQARAAGPLNFASSLIGGAGTAFNRFSWMQQNS